MFVHIKKNIALYSILLLCFTGAGFIYFKNSPQHVSGQKRVAFLVPAVHPSMEQIEEGFKVYLAQLYPDARVSVYNANGNKSLLHSQAEEIISNAYDAICTVGTNASQMVKNSLVKKHKKTPLVFMAISDPISAGVVDLDAENDPVTGIVDHYDFTQQLEYLYLIKPDLQSLTLVYDPIGSPQLDKHVQEIEKICHNHKVVLKKIEVCNAQELQQKVAPFLPETDVLLTLTDHTICSGMDTLIKLCKEAKKILYTSELDSNDKGALLSYGVQEKEYGTLAAQKVTAIFEGSPVHALPLTCIEPFFFKINVATAQELGITLDEQQLTQDPLVVLNHNGAL